MTIMQKASLTVNGNDLHLSVPFAKVNKEKRLVSGFATLDNTDSQGDVVTAEASLKAFKRARGNLREMHDKIAAGRVVDFREDEYFDKESSKFYRGIYVTAYVSKGAESTWEKVLDGTLSGFSIGGEVTESENEFDKAAGKSVRLIKDYDLVELSLVDNPANPLANVFSFQKAANGSVTGVTGMVTDATIENVFFCKEDTLIQSKSADSANCPECGEKMEVAGWFENAGDNRAEKVNSVIAKFLAASGDSEGGANMTKGNETVETGHEEGEPTEVPTPAAQPETEKAEVVDETAGTEDSEVSETVDEVTDDEEQISKMIDSLRDDLKDVVTKSVRETKEETARAVESLREHIEDFRKSVDEKISELDENYRNFSKSVGDDIEATKNRLAGVEGALEKFNSAEALRKSSELDSETRTQKSESIWNGAFSLDNVLRK